ncbi:hypothetical protein D1823_13660 [Ruegeria sp. AD91A]|uniref:hypothetical protein n=1 Tax=Ruegeria sp. AD91A TaxID=2293862 RepID=UPI000E4B769A|nr:hypothetical protein [Ruegeria sp. AD91A]AXT27529.1 hypothetical protein D1823_13660 [Ruegeria sp. AD91A]
MHTSKRRTSRRLVITVHGIRTFGGWQEQLENLLSKEPDADCIEVINYKYGYFSVLAFIIPFFRWLVVRKFRREMLSWCKKEHWERIDVIGHSFGTHVLAWALHGIPREERPKIHTIILSGSVLRGSFPWRDLVGGSVDRVVNDCGSKDLVLVINQLLVLFTGMAGRVGFSGATHQKFRNRFFEFGHSGYFYGPEGVFDDSWMRQFWLPLLQGNSAIEPHDERSPPSVVDGIFHTIANNAEPIKLTVYVAPVVLASVWVWNLYQDEANARKQAQISANNASQALLDQKAASAAQFLAEGKTTEAMIVALDAIPRLHDADAITENPSVRTVLARSIFDHNERARILGKWKNIAMDASCSFAYLIDRDNSVYTYDVERKKLVGKHNFLPVELPPLPNTPNEQTRLTAFETSSDGKYLIVRLQADPEQTNYGVDEADARKRQVEVYVLDTHDQSLFSTTIFPREGTLSNIEFTIDPDSESIVFWGDWGLSILDLDASNETPFGERKLEHRLTTELGGIPRSVTMEAGGDRVFVSLSSHPSFYPKTAILFPSLKENPINLGNFPDFWNEVKPNGDFSSVAVASERNLSEHSNLLSGFFRNNSQFDTWENTTIQVMSWGRFLLETSGAKDSADRLSGLLGEVTSFSLGPNEHYEFSEDGFSTQLPNENENGLYWVDHKYFDIGFDGKLLKTLRVYGADFEKRHGRCISVVNVDEDSGLPAVGFISIYEVSRMRDAILAESASGADISWRDENTLVWADTNDVTVLDIATGSTWTQSLNPPASRPYSGGVSVNVSPDARFVQYFAKGTGEPYILEVGNRVINPVITLQEEQDLRVLSGEIAANLERDGSWISMLQPYKLPSGEPMNPVTVVDEKLTYFILTDSGPAVFINYESGKVISGMDTKGEYFRLAEGLKIGQEGGWIIPELFLGKWQTQNFYSINSLESGDSIWSTPTCAASEISISPEGNRVAYFEDNTLWIENLPFQLGPLVEIACNLLPFDPNGADYQQFGLTLSGPICTGDYRASSRTLEIDRFWTELQSHNQLQ